MPASRWVPQECRPTKELGLGDCTPYTAFAKWEPDFVPGSIHTRVCWQALVIVKIWYSQKHWIAVFENPECRGPLRWNEKDHSSRQS